MSHSVLINGTSHKIGGGSCKVNGTQYKLNSGKTLIGGTSKNIKFTVPIPTDLTDTYWRWDTLPKGNPTKVNLTIKIAENRTDYVLRMLSISEVDIPCGTESPLCYAYATSGYTATFVGQTTGSSFYSYVWGYSSQTYSTSGGITQNSYPTEDVRYFHITGGSDVTKSSLINLLMANATQCDSSWNPL